MKTKNIFLNLYQKYFYKKDNKLALTLEGKNARAGYLFCLPFIIGFILFMLLPLLQSFVMIFNKVSIDVVNYGFKQEFLGLGNIQRALLIDPEYNRLLVEELLRMLLVVPAIIIFSLFIALLLNQEFKARGFVRAVFFLPVILSSGVLVGIETDSALLQSIADNIRQSNQMKSSITGVLEEILVVEGVGGDFMMYIFQIVNQIYTIAMASGIQIIIFLSALQTIPSSIYEAAKIEGATSWESFWKITFPMVSSLIIVIEGASLMSSVSGLKAKPHTANTLPVKSSPNFVLTLSTRTRFCRSLTSSTDWMSLGS
jgi:ABC-type sugar transport system permease subunit